MDEKLIEEISNTTGVPQMLVSRSAQARAEANGTDVNAVLSSWSGGTPTEVAPTPVIEEAVVAPVIEEAVVATCYRRSCGSTCYRRSCGSACYRRSY